MPAPGPRSRGARVHPRSHQCFIQHWLRASAASGMRRPRRQSRHGLFWSAPTSRRLRLATQEHGGITGRGTSGDEEARPDRHRRPHAGHARARRRERGRPCAPFPDGQRRVSARGDDVPVADARLPLVDRDRSAPGRPRHPAPRLVPPRRGAARRVRIFVQGDSSRRHDAGDPRRRVQHEPGASLLARGHGLRGARGRRARDGGGEHGLLPRACPARPRGALARLGPPSGRRGSSTTTSSSRT